MSIQAVASIWYPVSDWERAKAFYGGTLGLQLDFSDDESGWAAYSTERPGPPFFLVHKPEEAGGGGGGVIGFLVTNTHEFLDRLALAGVTIDDEVQDSDTVRIYTIYDPDGNPIELTEPK